MQASSADAVTRRETSSRVWVAYAVLLAAAVAGFFVIRHYGSGLVAPPPALPQTSGVESAAASGSLLRVLIALIAVIVTGQLLSRLLARLHQPPVIGEVLAGILLGPSLIGPELSALVLPPSVAPFLQVIAQLGVVLYMFLGKVGATFVAARLTGFRSRDAVTLGVLMNTRGLMELIVLNVGLELGVISPALFAMMVLMALATTLATGPLLKLTAPRRA